MKVVEKKSKAYQKYVSVFSIHNACPVTATMKIIGGKWKAIILYLISHDVTRFGEMMRHIEGISKKMLTDQLRELENDGVIHRKIYAEVPPRVEYSLTDLGFSIQPITKLMCKWGLENILTKRN